VLLSFVWRRWFLALSGVRIVSLRTRSDLLPEVFWTKFVTARQGMAAPTDTICHKEQVQYGAGHKIVWYVNCLCSYASFFSTHWRFS
jgi:hypothetical protein